MEQVELAMKLIDTKSKQADIKALNDVNEINFMINTAKPTVEFVNTARQLNKRIHEDYPEINEMHNIASNMANPASLCQDKSFSEYDVILRDLK